MFLFVKLINIKAKMSTYDFCLMMSDFVKKNLKEKYCNLI